jgi:hypothetical protein
MPFDPATLIPALDQSAMQGLCNGNRIDRANAVA